MLGLYFFVYKREKSNKHLMYIAILMGKCYTKTTKDKTSYESWHIYSGRDAMQEREPSADCPEETERKENKEDHHGIDSFKAVFSFSENKDKCKRSSSHFAA